MGTIIFSLCFYDGFCQFREPVMPEPVSISADRDFKEICLSAHICGMGIYKDYLIISNNIGDLMLHIYNRHTGEHVQSFAPVGSDPGELTSSMVEFSIDRNTGILTCHCSFSHRIIAYKIENILRGDIDGALCKEIEIKKKMPISVHEVWGINDKFLIYGVGSSSNVDFRIGFAYPDMSNIELNSVYSGYPMNFKQESKNKAHRSAMLKSVKHCNIEKKKLVIGSHYGKILEIFDIEPRIRPARITYYYEPTYAVSKPESRFPVIRPKSNSVMGYLDIDSSTEYIYALSWDPEDYDDEDGIRNITVYDWNGAPVAVLTTDYKLYRICGDSEGSVIYAIVPSPLHERQGYVVKFDIRGGI